MKHLYAMRMDDYSLQKNANVDALSRLQENKTVTTVFPEVMKHICQTVIAESINASLFEGIITESENTEMNKVIRLQRSGIDTIKYHT